jgi:hypothetical protein
MKYIIPSIICAGSLFWAMQGCKGTAEPYARLQDAPQYHEAQKLRGITGELRTAAEELTDDSLYDQYGIGFWDTPEPRKARARITNAVQQLGDRGTIDDRLVQVHDALPDLSQGPRFYDAEARTLKQISYELDGIAAAYESEIPAHQQFHRAGAQTFAGLFIAGFAALYMFSQASVQAERKRKLAHDAEIHKKWVEMSQELRRIHEKHKKN